MAATDMVIDTSIFIEYLRAKDKHKTILFSIPDDANLFISAVTLYELHMGAINEAKKQDIRMLTEDITILPFSEDIAVKAANIYHYLRNANQLIEFRDIFIAATCIMYNLPLKTTNSKHFSRISDLVLL